MHNNPRGATNLTLVAYSAPFEPQKMCHDEKEKTRNAEKPRCMIWAGATRNEDVSCTVAVPPHESGGPAATALCGGHLCTKASPPSGLPLVRQECRHCLQ